MKSVVLTLLVFLSISSSLANVYCTGNDQRTARDFYILTKEKNETGSLKKYDVLIAKATFLDVKHCAGNLSLPLYCMQKKDVLKKIMNIVKLLHENSMTATENVAWAYSQIINHRKTCN